MIVALPGGAGTTSETQLAVRYEKPIIALLGARLTIPDLDASIPVAYSLLEVEQFVRSHLPGLVG